MIVIVSLLYNANVGVAARRKGSVATPATPPPVVAAPAAATGAATAAPTALVVPTDVAARLTSPFTALVTWRGANQSAINESDQLAVRSEITYRSLHTR